MDGEKYLIYNLYRGSVPEPCRPQAVICCILRELTLGLPVDLHTTYVRPSLYSKSISRLPVVHNPI